MAPPTGADPIEAPNGEAPNAPADTPLLEPKRPVLLPDDAVPKGVTPVADCVAPNKPAPPPDDAAPKRPMLGAGWAAPNGLALLPEAAAPNKPLLLDDDALAPKRPLPAGWGNGVTDVLADPDTNKPPVVAPNEAVAPDVEEPNAAVAPDEAEPIKLVPLEAALPKRAALPLMELALKRFDPEDCALNKLPPVAEPPNADDDWQEPVVLAEQSDAKDGLGVRPWPPDDCISGSGVSPYVLHTLTYNSCSFPFHFPANKPRVCSNFSGL